MPCRTVKGQCHVVTGVTLNEYGQEKFQVVLDELRKERDAVIELGLIKVT